MRARPPARTAPRPPPRPSLGGVLVGVRVGSGVRLAHGIVQLVVGIAIGLGRLTGAWLVRRPRVGLVRRLVLVRAVGGLDRIGGPLVVVVGLPPTPGALWIVHGARLPALGARRNPQELIRLSCSRATMSPRCACSSSRTIPRWPA